MKWSRTEPGGTPASSEGLKKKRSLDKRLRKSTPKGKENPSNTEEDYFSWQGYFSWTGEKRIQTEERRELTGRKDVGTQWRAENFERKFALKVSRDSEAAGQTARPQRFFLIWKRTLVTQGETRGTMFSRACGFRSTAACVAHRRTTQHESTLGSSGWILRLADHWVCLSFLDP